MSFVHRLDILQDGIPALPAPDTLVVDIEMGINLSAIVVVPLNVATKVAIDAVERYSSLEHPIDCIGLILPFTARPYNEGMPHCLEGFHGVYSSTYGNPHGGESACVKHAIKIYC